MENLFHTMSAKTRAEVDQKTSRWIVAHGLGACILIGIATESFVWAAATYCILTVVLNSISQAARTIRS